MKWSALISLLVAASGVGVLCCCVPHSFGSGLRDIRNPMDSWPRWSFLALDLLAVLFIALSFFLYRARNWARHVVMAGCAGYSLLAVVGAVLLGALDANVADVVFIMGILVLSTLGPLFLIGVLRRPEVVRGFRGV
jgi:hypothetical protein